MFNIIWCIPARAPVRLLLQLTLLMLLTVLTVVSAALNVAKLITDMTKALGRGPLVLEKSLSAILLSMLLNLTVKKLLPERNLIPVTPLTVLSRRLTVVIRAVLYLPLVHIAIIPRPHVPPATELTPINITHVKLASSR